MTRSSLSLLLVGLLTSSACNRADRAQAASREAATAALADAQARWTQRRPAQYTFEYNRSCFCRYGWVWWRVTVRGESVVAIAVPDSNVAGATPASLLGRLTIDALFAELARLAADSLAVVGVAFDTAWHYPARISADPIPQADDDDWTLVVRAFRPLPN